MKKDILIIWERYNNIRIAGDKKTANKILTELISLLKSKDYSVRKDFVDHICALFLDDKVADNNGTEVSEKQIRIQHPLFKEIIVPVLIEEYKNKNAKYICWIGQFEQFFYSDYVLTTAFLKAIGTEKHFSTITFLEESFQIKKQQKTISLLLDSIARDLNYYIHEVPFGIIAEPNVFDEDINLFKNYYNQFENKNLWTEKLKEWETLSFHWKKYLANLNLYSNFEDYLTRNGIVYD